MNSYEEQITSAYQKQHMPFSYMTPEIPPETITVKFTDPDSIDLSTLNCDDFAEWLKAKNFSTEHCQAFKSKYVLILHNESWNTSKLYHTTLSLSLVGYHCY